MRADIVVDSSVVAKFFFHEDGSERARTALTSGAFVVAPALLLTELASIAVKKVRLGASTLERARSAMWSVGDLVDDLAPIEGLANRAFQLAADTGCSAYDTTYYALAERLGVPFLTADDRFVAKAAASGMGSLVWRL
jgi:predicted nucleic acid-binding protein